LAEGLLPKSKIVWIAPKKPVQLAKEESTTGFGRHRAIVEQ
jgi:hypothetical protein